MVCLAPIEDTQAMTSEEAYSWYAKCTGSPAAERAQRALRVLLAED